MSTKSALVKRVFVVGGSCSKFIGKGHKEFIHLKHPDFGKVKNPTLEEYIITSVQDVLKATNVPAQKIEKGWIGNFAGELFCKQGHLGAALVGADPAFRHMPSHRVEGACASGGLAFYAAVESLQATTDVALVCGAEVQNTVTPRQGGDFLAAASHYATQRQLDDFTFPALFARRIRAYRERYGVSVEDIARVSVKAYANGNLNPLAHMHRVKMDLATASTVNERNPNFLSNTELHPFLRVSDCSQVSDGGAAMILATEAGLRKLGKRPSDCIEVLTVTQCTDNLFKETDLARMENTAVAAQRAYAATGLKPSDMGVAEVHDCFSMAEVLMYEALGFAAPGKGTHALKEGKFDLTGSVPVNTGGGLIAFGHPVGATGVKQVLEVAAQIRGTAGAYQVKHAPRLGITANMGGDDKTTVVSILARVD